MKSAIPHSLLKHVNPRVAALVAVNQGCEIKLAKPRQIDMILVSFPCLD